MAVNGVEIRLGQVWRDIGGKHWRIAEYLPGQAGCWRIVGENPTGGIGYVNDQGCLSPSNVPVLDKLVSEQMPEPAPIPKIELGQLWSSTVGDDVIVTACHGASATPFSLWTVRERISGAEYVIDDEGHSAAGGSRARILSELLSKPVIEESPTVMPPIKLGQVWELVNHCGQEFTVDEYDPEADRPWRFCSDDAAYWLSSDGISATGVNRLERLIRDVNQTPEPTQQPDPDRTNPKDMIGDKKLALHLLSPIAEAHWVVAQYAGMLKYGAWNWRAAGVRSSVYISAARRHLAAYTSGEEFDPVDGSHHLGNVMACCAILLEAREIGKLTDDRPPCFSHRSAYKWAEDQMAALKVQYADKAPKHYTIGDKL